jgi:hypothetical protein
MDPRPNDTGHQPRCSGLGDPIALPTPTGPTCAAALATRGHRFALCSCESMNAPSRVRTDAYDSRDPSVADEIAAAIGIGGNLTSTAEVRAGGAFYVAGAGGDRRVEPQSLVAVAARGRPGGDPERQRRRRQGCVRRRQRHGNLRVNGTLHVPAGAVLSGGPEASAIVNEPVSVPSPCDCSAGFVNVAPPSAPPPPATRTRRSGSRPTRWRRSRTPAMFDLPAARFYVDKIYADAAVTIAVHGRTVLAVAGDVALHAAFSVVLDPSAELDLIVGGRLSTSGGGAFGAGGAAARFRAWIAGTSTISFDDAPAINAVVQRRSRP